MAAAKRNQALEALKRIGLTPEAVLEEGADALLVLDADGGIVYWNRGAVETFGHAPNEVLGSSYEILLPPDREIEAELSEVLTTGRTVHDLRAERRREDGRLFNVSLTRSPLIVSDDVVSGAVEIIRDVTSHREIEQEMIHNEKMAAVGKIASKVVHEIRNPLGTINLNVDLLLDSLGLGDSPEETEAREILRTIKRETHRLSRIAEEYLQFSRMPQSGSKVEDLNDVLLELADFLRPELRRSGIRLVLNLDDRRPKVACDGRLLRQIVLNLIRNAMDVVPSRSGQVMIVSTAHESTATIEIHDNGSGIPAEILPKIFDPFFTTKQEGTGLGLAVVLQIVEEHGGSISCQSVPDKGTTFRISLPQTRPR